MRETVILVFFDVPVATCEDRRSYRKFRVGLKKGGYTMLQKSVYYKLLVNVSLWRSERKKVSAIVPAEGNVLLLPVSLRQFSRMTCLVGVPFPFLELCSPIIEI